MIAFVNRLYRANQSGRRTTKTPKPEPRQGLNSERRKRTVRLREDPSKYNLSVDRDQDRRKGKRAIAREPFFLIGIATRGRGQLSIRRSAHRASGAAGQEEGRKAGSSSAVSRLDLQFAAHSRIRMRGGTAFSFYAENAHVILAGADSRCTT